MMRRPFNLPLLLLTVIMASSYEHLLSPTIVVDAAAYDPRTVGKSYLEPPPSFQQQQSTISSDDESLCTTNPVKQQQQHHHLPLRGGGLIPAGYNPFGYKIAPLGEKFLEFDGSLETDIGRFIASIKERKTLASIKSQWLEIVRVSKSAQTMRIYRTLQEIIDFCLEAGFIN